MPLRRRSRHFERSIEGAARNNDSQILIEHEERFADRVHDRFGQQERLLATLKSLPGFVGHRDSVSAKRDCALSGCAARRQAARSQAPGAAEPERRRRASGQREDSEYSSEQPERRLSEMLAASAMTAWI